MPYITAALALYGVGSSIYKQQQAKKAIKKLEDYKPKFRTAKDIQTEAELMNRRGFSPVEEANFRQGLARQNNASYQKATQTNPNLSGAVGAGINYGNIQAINEFAARDEQVRRQKVQDYIGLTRGQSNAQTEADLISKREREIAYGNAKNQADAELYNQLAQLGYAGSKMNLPQGTTPVTDGAFGGGAPLMSYQNPAPPAFDANQYARGLYGNPVTPPPPPQFGTTQFGYRRQPSYLDSSYYTY